MYALIKSCFGDDEKLDAAGQAAQAKNVNKTVAKECILLTYCFFG